MKMFRTGCIEIYNIKICLISSMYPVTMSHHSWRLSNIKRILPRWLWILLESLISSTFPLLFQILNILLSNIPASEVKWRYPTQICFKHPNPKFLKVKQEKKRKKKGMLKSKLKVPKRIVNLISLIIISLFSALVGSLRKLWKIASHQWKLTNQVARNFFTYFTILPRLWIQEEAESTSTSPFLRHFLAQTSWS